MYSLTNFLNKRKQLAFTITCISIMILAVTSPAAASVNNWEFSPQEPVCGDIINIRGNGSPEEKIDVFVTFEKTVPVSKGKFEYTLEDIKIPAGLDNLFTVDAKGAKKLNVRVKMVIWVSKSSEASGGTATVSQSSVPPGTYMIKIDGDANEGISSVDLKITAYQGIKADSNGDFSYSYNTKAVPAGDFEIKVGNIMKTVAVQPEGSSDWDSKSGSDSSESLSSSSSSSVNLPSTISSSEKNRLSKLVENKSSSLPETEPSSEQVASKTLKEKNDSGVLAPDKDSEEERIQAQSMEKNTAKYEFFRLFVDKIYLLIGVGAAILILIYILKKKAK